MASINIDSATSGNVLGYIPMTSTEKISQDWERFSIKVSNVDAGMLLEIFGKPPVIINPNIPFYESFALYKHPFVFSGSDIFEFGEKGGYSIDGINKLDAEILYKYKFYVYMGMNALTWEDTFFGNNKPGMKKSDLYGLFEIDTNQDIDIGVERITHKSFDPFSKEWINTLALYPQMQLYFPNFLGLSLLYLNDYFNGVYFEKKVDNMQMSFIMNPSIRFDCFNSLYQSLDYKYTQVNIVNFKNIPIYNQWNIPSNANWCPEYGAPFGYFFVNDNNQNIQSQVGVPVLFYKELLNVITKPNIPIVTTFTVQDNLFMNYGQNIYFIFPMLDSEG